MTNVWSDCELLVWMTVWVWPSAEVAVIVSPVRLFAMIESPSWMNLVYARTALYLEFTSTLQDCRPSVEPPLLSTSRSEYRLPSSSATVQSKLMNTVPQLRFSPAGFAGLPYTSSLPVDMLYRSSTTCQKLKSFDCSVYTSALILPAMPRPLSKLYGSKPPDCQEPSTSLCEISLPSVCAMSRATRCLLVP